MEDFIQKHKIQRIYKYAEDPPKDGAIVFGWVESNELDLSGPVVISYHSKTTKATEEERARSKEEGVNATSLSDYRKYFKSLTGFKPEDFLLRWERASDKEYQSYWKGQFPDSDKDSHLFIKAIAKLIVEQKKFIMFGRGFKIVMPELENSKELGKVQNDGQGGDSSGKI